MLHCLNQFLQAGIDIFIVICVGSASKSNYDWVLKEWLFSHNKFGIVYLSIFLLQISFSILPMVWPVGEYVDTEMNTSGKYSIRRRIGEQMIDLGVGQSGDKEVDIA